MVSFRLITNPEKKYIDQAWIFNDEYFTVDTAERRLVDTWYQKNGKNMIYALSDEEVFGFFNVIPLTEECSKQFENNAIREEEIHADDILGPESMKFAQSIYIAGIAVKNRQTLKGKQCVAALMSGLCNRIRTLYDPAYLKKIYVNPTTFDGNRFTRKLGLEPVRPAKKFLRAGNDIYALELSSKTFDMFRGIEGRYERFVSENSWGNN